MLSVESARQVEVRARATGGGAYLEGTVSAATANGTAAFTALRVSGGGAPLFISFEAGRLRAEAGPITVVHAVRPHTLNPWPETRNPKSETPNPKP